MARRIHGGAGPEGSTAIQWQHLLLRCGSHCAKLRDAIADLVRHLANGIGKWTDIQALNVLSSDCIGQVPRSSPHCNWSSNQKINRKGNG